MKKHLNHRTKKRIIAALMALTMGIGIAPDAYASAVSNAQNKKNQAQSDLDSVNNSGKKAAAKGNPTSLLLLFYFAKPFVQLTLLGE